VFLEIRKSHRIVKINDSHIRRLEEALIQSDSLVAELRSELHNTQSKLDKIQNDRLAETERQSLLLKSLENELQHLRSLHNVVLTNLNQVLVSSDAVMTKLDFRCMEKYFTIPGI